MVASGCSSAARKGWRSMALERKYPRWDDPSLGREERHALAGGLPPAAIVVPGESVRSCAGKRLWGHPSREHAASLGRGGTTGAELSVGRGHGLRPYPGRRGKGRRGNARSRPSVAKHALQHAAVFQPFWSASRVPGRRRESALDDARSGHREGVQYRRRVGSRSETAPARPHRVRRHSSVCDGGRAARLSGYRDEVHGEVQPREILLGALRGANSRTPKLDSVKTPGDACKRPPPIRFGETHFSAHSLRRTSEYDQGHVVVVSCEGDGAAESAIAGLSAELDEPASLLRSTTYEALIDVLNCIPEASRWAKKFRRRYLDLSPVRD